MCNFKSNRVILNHFQRKPFNTTVIPVYAPTTNSKEDDVEWFCNDIQDLLQLTPKKRCPFHHRELQCKSRKSRDIGSKRQVWPWSTKWAGQRLTDFCQENALIIENTLFQQHKRQLYTWTSPDSQYLNQIDSILCPRRWRHSIQSTKTRLGTECGSDHEFLTAKFRLELKKVGKTTRHSGMT